MPRESDKFMLAQEASATEWKDEEHGWLYEVKYDGERVLAIVKDGAVKLTNRDDRDITHRYPELRKLPLPNGVFDGELCVMRGGKSDFLALATRSHLENNLLIRVRSEKMPATLVIFDLLELEGKDYRGLPLEARLSALNMALPQHFSFKTPERFRDFEEAWRAVRSRGEEGVVAKRLGSAYEAGKRSSAWVKLKAWAFIEHDFPRYEDNERGITLTDGKHRVCVSDASDARRARDLINEKGVVRVVVRYLAGCYTEGWRQPTCSGIAEDAQEPEGMKVGEWRQAEAITKLGGAR